eukprot:2653163-Amphidinium_carterae.1
MIKEVETWVPLTENKRVKVTFASQPPLITNWTTENAVKLHKKLSRRNLDPHYQPSRYRRLGVCTYTNLTVAAYLMIMRKLTGPSAMEYETSLDKEEKKVNIAKILSDVLH